jgi:hypothetical protein
MEHTGARTIVVGIHYDTVRCDVQQISVGVAKNESGERYMYRASCLCSLAVYN